MGQTVFKQSHRLFKIQLEHWLSDGVDETMT